MKKAWMGVTVFLLAGLLLSAAWERKEKEEGEMPVRYQDLPQIHLMVASNLHYLSPCLTDHGEYFTEMIRHSDGKVMEYCIGCGTCARNCPQRCIESGKPYKIMQEHCLHCESCYERCPVQAVRRRECI